MDLGEMAARLVAIDLEHEELKKRVKRLADQFQPDEDDVTRSVQLGLEIMRRVASIDIEGRRIARELYESIDTRPSDRGGIPHFTILAYHAGRPYSLILGRVLPGDDRTCYGTSLMLTFDRPEPLL